MSPIADRYNDEAALRELVRAPSGDEPNLFAPARAPARRAAHGWNAGGIALGMAPAGGGPGADGSATSIKGRALKARLSHWALLCTPRVRARPHDPAFVFWLSFPT